MANKQFLLQHLFIAMTLVTLGAPFIGYGLSIFADDISLRIRLLDGRTTVSIYQHSRWQLLAAIAAIAAVLLMAGLSYGARIEVLYITLFGIILILLAAVDLKTGYLPNSLTLSLLVGGLIINYWHLFASFSDAWIGAVLGFFLLMAASNLHLCWQGQVGFGRGDAKMLAAIGAWIGYTHMIFAVIVAILGASAQWLILIAYRRLRGTQDCICHSIGPAAFGPYLALGGIAAFPFLFSH